MPKSTLSLSLLHSLSLALSEYDYDYDSDSVFGRVSESVKLSIRNGKVLVLLDIPTSSQAVFSR